MFWHERQTLEVSFFGGGGDAEVDAAVRRGLNMDVRGATVRLWGGIKGRFWVNVISGRETVFRGILKLQPINQVSQASITAQKYFAFP